MRMTLVAIATLLACTEAGALSPPTPAPNEPLEWNLPAVNSVCGVRSGSIQDNRMGNPCVRKYREAWESANQRMGIEKWDVVAACRVHAETSIPGFVDYVAMNNCLPLRRPNR